MSVTKPILKNQISELVTAYINTRSNKSCLAIKIKRYPFHLLNNHNQRGQIKGLKDDWFLRMNPGSPKVGPLRQLEAAFVPVKS